VSEQNHNKMIEQIFVKVTGQVPAMTEQIWTDERTVTEKTAEQMSEINK
jgi:hypothetical protein